MNKFIVRQSLLLLLTATIWGTAFVAQSVGMGYIGPFTFNAVRCIIGAGVLVPCIALLDKLKSREETKEEEGQERKFLVTGGICCGVILAIASTLQQYGILYSAVGKAGFITAMYIILVPVFSIFLKKRAGIRIWISVLIAVAGLYLLCMTGGIHFEKGDIYLLLCAVMFSFHILVIDYFSPKTDGVKMSCIQFLTCGIICGICMFLFETPSLTAILEAWQPVLYAGVLSCGVAYTLQIVGQKGMNPTVASLIMSLESVISVIAGFFILHQVLSRRELVGCALMFVAIVIAQIDRKIGRPDEEQKK